MACKARFVIFIANRYANIEKVSHECLRDDRPPHGRVGRAIGIYLRVSVSECHGKPVERM